METINKRNTFMYIFFLIIILCYLYVLSYFSIMMVRFDPFHIILTDFGYAALDGTIFTYINLLVLISSFVFLYISRSISTKWNSYMKIVTHITLWSSLIMLGWTMFIWWLASGLHS